MGKEEKQEEKEEKEGVRVTKCATTAVNQDISKHNAGHHPKEEEKVAKEEKAKTEEKDHGLHSMDTAT